MPATLTRIDACCDAIARAQGRAEPHGALVLFVREGPGFPLYARPAPDAGRAPGPADIAGVRARQRELGVPEAFEWLDETAPGLVAAAEAGGLSVMRAPLMVLDDPRALPAPLADVPVRLLDPAGDTYPDDLAMCRAVGAVGFGNPGTGVGPAGSAERDAARPALTPEAVRAEAARATAGHLVRALVETADGPVATGVLLRAGDVAEIAGLATLPAMRRRGVGRVLTAALARYAFESGVDLVFLSAASDEVARIYQAAGFARVGTACVAGPPSGG